MNDLQKFVDRFEADEQAASNSRVLLSYLKDAMDPFRPVNPWVEVAFNRDYRTYVIRVGMKNLPWFFFRHEVTAEQLLSLFDPNVLFVEVGLSILDYWNEFEWITPEDHIILSEN